MQGTAEALNAVHSFIAEKVREIPQAMTKPEVVNILQPQTTMNPDRAKQVSRGSAGFRKAGAVREVTHSPIPGSRRGFRGLMLITCLAIKCTAVVGNITIRESAQGRERTTAWENLAHNPLRTPRFRDPPRPLRPPIISSPCLSGQPASHFRSSPEVTSTAARPPPEALSLSHSLSP